MSILIYRQKNKKIILASEKELWYNAVMIDYEKIKVLSIDVDGTLTDGLYQIDKDGNVVKSFYTRDFCGIQMLLEAGIRVVIITQSHDTVIRAQVNRIASHSNIWRDALLAEEVYFDNRMIIKIASNNKKEFVENYLSHYNLTLENLAHIGDAENDMELLEVAGYTACPADAIEDITDVNYRCENKGGRGAVHEFCRHLLAKRGK